MKLKVRVDRGSCIACGIAPNLCSDVFMLGDDNGKNRLTEKYSEETSDVSSVGVVGEDLFDCVKEAAEACPVQAITMEKIEG